MKSFFRRRTLDKPTPSPSPEPVLPNAGQTTDELIAYGNRLEDSGDPDGAREAYERAIRLTPDSFRAHLNLGNALLRLGRRSDAAKHYHHSIQLNPDFAGAYLNLGNVLMTDQAFLDAAGNYRSAIRLRPDWADAWFGLGRALEEAKSFDDALGAYKEALQFDPAHGKAASHLAAGYFEKGQSLAARKTLENVLLHAPGNAQALRAQADIDQKSGDPKAAVAAYRQILSATPDDDTTYSSFLFALNFVPDINGEVILAEHRRYGELLASRIPASRSRAAADGDKRLKVGYVSPDFRRHSVSCFIEPLLRHHDRSIVDVHCYYNHAARDDITQRFVGLADYWCDIADLSDEAVAQRITDDGIDILVDLAGHTGGNRLGVFARKPAPIQFTWLGYLCTTGLNTIDYRLCDFHTDPVDEAELWQVEKPIRLPDSQWCYQPQVALPDVSTLPRLTNGYWTFGSFNQSSKLNLDTLQAWGHVLGEIPDSRLRILGVTDSLLEERIRSFFAQQGVSSDRLDLIGRIPIDAYFSSYLDVDIALDSAPYNGATTTCDALVMGVPVATMTGNRSIARGGLSLLSTLGMKDWIAPSAEKLVDLLREHTSVPARLAALRMGLPERMRTSALMDGPRFARNVEVAFRTAWRQAAQASNEARTSRTS